MCDEFEKIYDVAKRRIEVIDNTSSQNHGKYRFNKFMRTGRDKCCSVIAQAGVFK